VAYVYDADWFEAEQFELCVDQANQDFLVPQNVIALTDHPDSPESVNGVIMNQGKYAIVFVQSLSKVNHFARLLANRGYYHAWPEQYLTDLFAHREDPRHGI
jgi:phenylalanine-4-hydroxylase